MGKVRDRFGSMGRFKGGFRCKGWVNSVIINVITEMIYRCNYMQIVFTNISTIKNMHVHNKCIVPNYEFKCKYTVVKAV